MLYLGFRISNPWGKNKFVNLRNKSWLVSKNKAIELEFCRSDDVIVNGSFNISTRSDHAGVHITLGLLFYVVDFNFYDTRHWNYKTNDWELYNE
jgi:hypothetical protein